MSGPYSASALLAMARKGELVGTSQIRAGLNGPWQSVSAFANELSKRKTELAANNPPAIFAQETMPVICTRCGSRQIQRLEVVWSSGTSTASSLSIGGGIAFATELIPFINSQVTSASQQTELARIVQPPTVPYDDVASQAVHFVLRLFDSSGVDEMRRREMLRYEAEVAEWKRKWFCHQCGEVFLPIKFL